MADWWPRMIGKVQPNIPQRPFFAMSREYSRGEITQAQLAASFNLDTQDLIEIGEVQAAIVSRADPLYAMQVTEDIGEMSESFPDDFGYNTKDDVIARIMKLPAA